VRKGVEATSEIAMLLKTICLSHSPLMELVSPSEGIATEVRARLKELADDVAAYRPDLLILFAPDHFNGFFYDLMPAFCVGAAATAIGDYGTDSGQLRTDENLAVKLAEFLGEQGFDIAVSYRMQVDHGFAQPLSLLTGSLQRYPVIPIFINSAAPPLPSMKRVRKFGRAVGEFALTTGQKILVVGSGGLSHDPPVPSIKTASLEQREMLISGRDLSPEARRLRQERTVKAAEEFAAGAGNLRDLNEEWDRSFLALLESGDLTKADSYSDDWITAEGGRAGHEIRTWLAAFAAQSASGPYKTNLLYQCNVPHWIVDMAIAKLESRSPATA